MAFVLVSWGVGMLFWYEPEPGPSLYSGLGVWLVHATAVGLILAGFCVFAFGFFVAGRALNTEEGLDIPGPIVVPANPRASTLGRLLESPGAPNEGELLATLETFLNDPTDRGYIFRLVCQRVDRLPSREVVDHLRGLAPPTNVAGAKAAFLEAAASLANPNPALLELFQRAFAATPERITRVVAKKLLASELPQFDDPGREAALVWKEFARRATRAATS